MGWALMILALCAVLVWLYRLRQEQPWARTALAVGIALGLVLTAVRVGRSCRPPPAPHMDRAIEQALGQIAAEEFARLADGAPVVLVLPHGIVEGYASPAAESRTRAFLAGAEAAGLQIVAQMSPLAAYAEDLDDPTDPDALEEPIAILMDVGVDYRSVQYAIRNIPQARVIICLDGVPTYGVGRMPGLEDRMILGIDLYGIAPDWAHGLRRGQLSAVIAPRNEPGPASAARRPSRREIFDRHYLLVTNENVDTAMPEITGAK